MPRCSESAAFGGQARGRLSSWRSIEPVPRDARPKRATPALAEAAGRLEAENRPPMATTPHAEPGASEGCSAHIGACRGM